MGWNVRFYLKLADSADTGISAFLKLTQFLDAFFKGAALRRVCVYKGSLISIRKVMELREDEFRKSNRSLLRSIGDLKDQYVVKADYNALRKVRVLVDNSPGRFTSIYAHSNISLLCRGDDASWNPMSSQSDRYLIWDLGERKGYDR